MNTGSPERRCGVTAVVVTFDSAEVIGRCLEALHAAAPRHGLQVRVVDNASSDGSADIAARVLGDAAVTRAGANRGFAAGVNQALVSVSTPWVAVLNPDVVAPPGSLDRLVEVLAAHAQAALVGPRLRDDHGHAEASAGLFPTLARERAHALMLDRLLGWEGRRAAFPRYTAPVDWVSGCAWLLRTSAVLEVGPLDEDYFMYFEDVDYCRRLTDAGWQVLATPEVELVHSLSAGSRGTVLLPADGGRAALRYFAKHQPGVEGEARRLLLRGWRLRRVWRGLRAHLGDQRSAARAERYRLAMEAVERG